MALRGEKLREHILWTAKDVFIETGFERTSMDLVAARAATSKRSLYAHFESKDALFTAVVALVGSLYLGRLGAPDDGEPTDPADAVVRYCGRFLQLVLWDKALSALRLGIAEAERLPAAAADYHEAIFEVPQQRLAGFLVERYALEPAPAHEIAHRLLGRAIYPQLTRRLFGVDPPLPQRPDDDTLADDVDLGPLRAAAADLLPATPPPPA